VVVAAILSKCLSSGNLRFRPGRIDAVNDHEIFALIGEEGFRQLVAAFYRQVPADDILGPMYPADDLAGAEQRLRDFLVGRFGGPSRYIEQRGHPRLRMRHTPFAIAPAARDRWMQLMTTALDETRLPAEADLILRPFFAEVAAMMINRQE
jgi:hemoglobin